MPLSEYPSTLGNPFTLGVASGEPLSDGVVLWTRLAPDPLAGPILSARHPQYRTLQPCDDQLANCTERFEDPIVDENG